MILNNECFELIKEIKNSVPHGTNLCSNISTLDKFAYVQELIAKLAEFELEEPFTGIIQTFKDYFHPVLMSTVSYESEFIKIVQPILRYPNLSIRAAEVIEQRFSMPRAYSYKSVLGKLIDPTPTEIKISDLLFAVSTNQPAGLRQTKAINILIDK